MSKPTRLQLRQTRKAAWNVYKHADEELTREEFESRMLVAMGEQPSTVLSPLMIFLLKIGWDLFMMWLKKKMSKNQAISLIPLRSEPDYDAFTQASPG